MEIDFDIVIIVRKVNSSEDQHNGKKKSIIDALLFYDEKVNIY